jgi:hypothetical protein
MVAGIGGQIYERENVLEIRPLAGGTGRAFAKDPISKSLDERNLPRTGAIGDHSPKAQQLLGESAGQRKAGIEGEAGADDYEISRIKHFRHVAPLRATSYHQSRNQEVFREAMALSRGQMLRALNERQELGLPYGGRSGRDGRKADLQRTAVKLSPLRDAM